MYPVVAVLHACGGSQVRFAIIVAVMVDMIDEKMVGRVDNLSMHLNGDSLLANPRIPARIIGHRTPDHVPFVFIQSLEIFRIDDGVFALGKRYPAEGVAVTGPAVQQRQCHERP